MDYSIFHVEKYGHGKQQKNDLPDDKKIIIAHHDGYYDVYACDSDVEAEKIANWYVSAGYATYPDDVTIKKINPRYYSIEITEADMKE